MALFGLVHGACHGPWSWRRVERILRSNGHDVIAPTLSGCAEREHLLAPDVGLATHVVDLAQTLYFEDARDVILVGHSYGGMVITGVAGRAGGRIKHLVYVDAYLPRHGETMLQLVAEEFRDLFSLEQDGWRVPPPTPEELGITDPSDIAWVRERLRHHPMAAYTEPVDLGSSQALGISGTYVLCVSEAFGHMARRARAAGWTVHHLPTGHDPMIEAPEDLTRLLIACAAGDGRRGENRA